MVRPITFYEADSWMVTKIGEHPLQTGELYVTFVLSTKLRHNPADDGNSAHSGEIVSINNIRTTEPSRKFYFLQ